MRTGPLSVRSTEAKLKVTGGGRFLELTNPEGQGLESKKKKDKKFLKIYEVRQ